MVVISILTSLFNIINLSILRYITETIAMQEMRLWTYSGRGPQKECPAYESAWKSGDGSLADESGEVDEGIAYKTYKL